MTSSRPPIKGDKVRAAKKQHPEWSERRIAREIGCSVSYAHGALHPRQPTQRDRQLNRSSHLKRTYNITAEEYDARVASQEGACAICERKPRKYKLSVDHDHDCCPGPRSCGRCIRGLLCSGCNYDLLGRICQETKLGKPHAIAVLRRAIEHLERTRESNSEGA